MVSCRRRSISCRPCALCTSAMLSEVASSCTCLLISPSMYCVRRISSSLPRLTSAALASALRDGNELFWACSIVQCLQQSLHDRHVGVVEVLLGLRQRLHGVGVHNLHLGREHSLLGL